jgi:uncharacterized protein
VDSPRIAIVTGASSGIGAATAIELGARGYTVVLAARRRQRLEQVRARVAQAGGRGDVQVCDVGIEEQVQRLVDGCVQRHGRLDVMINNAGFGMFGRIHELTTEQMRRIFEVNYLGLFWGARAAGRVMARQGTGHIFNVSSVIGKRGTPYHGAYCASKFAVVGLSDSMRVELAPLGVHVTCVCPGLTDTEFFTHSPQGQAAEGTFQAIKGGLQDPRIVARKMVQSIGKRRPELVFTPGGKILIVLACLFPRLTDRLMGFYRDSLSRSMSQQKS